MKKLFSFLILTLTTYSFSMAQCGFDVQRSKAQQDPQFVKNEQLFENKIQQFIKSGAVNNKAGGVYTIPVVVHVLHLGEAEGVGTNISDAQIQSGIDRLNEVYRGLDPNSPIDFEVQFALAKQNPSCIATDGINRVDASGVPNYSTDGVFFDTAGADENTLKDLSRWDETQYCNIWIVSEIDGNNGGAGYQGYASFFSGNAYNGSVMMASVFGYDPGNTNGWGLNSNGDGGTVVHEFGHYLHLYHTFQGDGTGSTCPDDVGVGTGSDGCADTETHKRHTSTCPTNNDCNSNNPYGINTRNNYMSYFSCTDRLTSDQKTRVRAALANTSIVASRGDEAPLSTPAIAAASCTPTSTNAFNSSGVFDVELNGFIVSTLGALGDNNPNGYLDNSGNCAQYFSIDATVGNSMDVTVGYNNNPGVTHQLGVWIDWNNDGDFDDTNEQQHVSSGHAASSVVNVSLIYPPSINYDSSVRMRVVSDLHSGPVPTSCGNPTYGQAEDYKLYIEPNVAAPPVADFNASTTTVCNGSSTVFTDASTNTPTSWSWTFTPSTVTYINSTSSSSQNPDVQFDAAGTYQVQLTATNASGSDDEIKVGYVTVNSCSGPSIVSNQCNTTASSVHSFNYCYTVPSATSYEFRLTEIGTGNEISRRINGVAYFKLSQMNSWEYNTAYNLSARAYVSGVWSEFGVPCVITTPAIVPTVVINSNQCNTTISSLNSFIYCGAVPTATYHQFRLTEQGTGNEISIRTNVVSYFKLSQMNNWSYNTTYDLSARAYIDGAWTAYGPSCPITTPTNVPTIVINSAQCNTTIASVNSYTYCTNIPTATSYQFKLTEQSTGDEVSTRINSVAYFKISQMNNWVSSTTYDLSARAYIDGSWTDYGSSCPITTPADPLLISQKINNNYSAHQAEGDFENVLSMAIYPNPNEGESFNLELEGIVPSAKVMLLMFLEKQFYTRI